MAPITSILQQIHIGPGPRGYEPVQEYAADKATYTLDQEKLSESLLRRCSEHVWPKGTYLQCCPRPVLIGDHHLRQLKELHEALTLAITDTVERWWTDVDARLPERMPLEKAEEDLLRVRL